MVTKATPLSHLVDKVVPMTASTPGLVPTPPNDANKYLNGAGLWTVPPANTVTSVPGDLTFTTPLAKVLGTPQFASINSGPLAGFRNRIINGGFDVWQRGASIVCTTGTYSADHWRMYAAGANITVSQDTSVSDTPCYLITGATSNTVANFGQPIESANLDDLVTGPVTISYEVYSSTARAVGITTYYFNTKDSGVGTMTLGPSNQSILTTTINTWQKVTLTIASLATAFKNGAYIDLNFGAVTAGQTVRVRNVQLESGTVATPFEVRPIGTELALCQRYYEQSESLSGVIGHRTLIASNNTVAQGFTFMTQKRVTPTVTLYGRTGVAGRLTNNTTGVATANVSTVNGVSTQGVGYITESGGGFTAGIGYEANYTAVAEL